jgi:hypothetical protein
MSFIALPQKFDPGTDVLFREAKAVPPPSVLPHALDGISCAESAPQVVAFETPSPSFPFTPFDIRWHGFPPVAPLTFPQEWMAIVDLSRGEAPASALPREVLHLFELERPIMNT